MKELHSSQHTIPESGRERDAALERLHRDLLEIKTHEFAEVWVDHDNFPTLCALIHRDRGWLMLIRYEGDAGYSSRGSDSLARSGADLDFVLSNGQTDRYPFAWTLPTGNVLEALEHFAAWRGVPETIHWHNDSGDDSSGPNDQHFDYLKLFPA